MEFAKRLSLKGFCKNISANHANFDHIANSFGVKRNPKYVFINSDKPSRNIVFHLSVISFCDWQYILKKPNDESS